MTWRKCCRRNGCPEVLVVNGNDSNGEPTIIHIRDDDGSTIRLTPTQLLEVYATVQNELSRVKRAAP